MGQSGEMVSSFCKQAIIRIEFVDQDDEWVNVQGTKGNMSCAMVDEDILHAGIGNTITRERSDKISCKYKKRVFPYLAAPDRSASPLYVLQGYMDLSDSWRTLDGRM